MQRRHLVLKVEAFRVVAGNRSASNLMSRSRPTGVAMKGRYAALPHAKLGGRRWMVFDRKTGEVIANELTLSEAIDQSNRLNSESASAPVGGAGSCQSARQPPRSR